MALLAENLGHVLDAVVDHGFGVRFTTEGGAQYLDFSAGIAAASTGHCHPHVVQAVRDQAGRIIHAQGNIAPNRPALAVAERLGSYLPEGLDRMWIGCTGAEAIEAAVRLARHASARPNIIAFEGGFHGRTMGAGSLTSSTSKVRAGMSPLMGGVVFAPFPNPRRYGWAVEDSTDFALAELDRIFGTISHPADTAAFLVEPIQGEGGYVPGNTRFFTELRERADRHGIAIVLDEVQAGWGRTGRFWAAEHFDLQPDILVMGKGMASGFPVSAIAAPKRLMDRAWPGSQGGTFWGHAVGCAAVLATLDVLESEGLVRNAAIQGELLLSELRRSSAGFPQVADVRGLGLMVGVEFRDATGAPDPLLAAAVQAAALRCGLLVLTCGPQREVIRLTPALVVQPDDIEQAVQAWASALAAATGEPA